MTANKQERNRKHQRQKKAKTLTKKSRKRKRHKRKSSKQKNSNDKHGNNANHNNLNANANENNSDSDFVDDYFTDKRRKLMDNQIIKVDTKNEILQKLHESKKKYMQMRKSRNTYLSNIILNMSPAQEHRFECWNRSVLNRNIVKETMGAAMNCSKSRVNDECAIVMQALSKCIVLELTAKARQIQQELVFHQTLNYTNPSKMEKNNDRQVLKYNRNNNDNDNANVVDSHLNFGILDEYDMNCNDNGNDNSNTDNAQHRGSGDAAVMDVLSLGPIQPIHIREAFRALTNDPTSFLYRAKHTFLRQSK